MNKVASLRQIKIGFPANEKESMTPIPARPDSSFKHIIELLPAAEQTIARQEYRLTANRQFLIA